MWEIRANKLLPKALKVTQSAKNCPIWSHWLPRGIVKLEQTSVPTVKIQKLKSIICFHEMNKACT